MRERLSQELDTEIKDNLFGPGLKDDFNHYLEAMKQINKVHLLMLVKQNLLERNVGSKLATVLLDLDEEDSLEQGFSANREDLYFNIEANLISRLGVDIAGRLHTGRSRNDLYATASRIKIRELYFEICDLIIALRKQLLDIAEDEVETVIPGYTHMQAAEPITFGHYFSAIAEALERDYSRIEDSYRRLNLSPLGSGALAGTSFQIDRSFTAKYLGFDDVLRNSLDAVASRDYLAEFLSGLAILMTTISRFSQDLYIMATSEFQAIEVSDSVAASSSIMPQKKNPVTLEHIKGKASHLFGGLMSILATLKGIPFTHCRDASSECFGLFWPAVLETKRAVKLLSATLSNLKINREKLYHRTMQNFSTVTELANNIVRYTGMSFREAHGIVGEIVLDLFNRGLEADSITVNELEHALSNTSIYNQLDLECLKKIVTISLEPLENVKAKKSEGSPNPDLVKEMILQLKNNLNNQIITMQARCTSVVNAQEALEQKVKALADQK